jgi:SAM-dependent methyltransferase
MTNSSRNKNGIRLKELRDAIRQEYQTVASEPDKGFHFHTGRRQAKIVGYPDDLLARVPQAALESFAGTGNPFNLGPIQAGERVVDIGSGAGTDSLIAAGEVGPEGRVIGIDMTEKMLEKARRARAEAGLEQVEFRYGHGEDLPVADEWADVVISNGVLNLMPDKTAALKEMNRVLKPEGRLQIADIIVKKEVPISAKRQTDLWIG